MCSLRETQQILAKQHFLSSGGKKKMSGMKTKGVFAAALAICMIAIIGSSLVFAGANTMKGLSNNFKEDTTEETEDDFNVWDDAEEFDEATYEHWDDESYSDEGEDFDWDTLEAAEEEIWETVDVLYEKNWAAFEPLEEELDVLYDELYAALEADNNADILRLAKATYQAELDIFALEDSLGISELYEEMDLLWEEAEALEGSWEHEGEGCEHDEEFDFEDYDKDDFQDEE